MEKIIFFGNLEIAIYWFKEVAKYLTNKNIDYQVNRKFLEIEANGVRLVFMSVQDYERVERAMVGRRYSDIISSADLDLEREFEKTIMKLIGGKDNE